ncbi:MAG: hypothetical protein WCW17_00060 [Patescibacteria group bacterium]|jgi:hypothetical protein
MLFRITSFCFLPKLEFTKEGTVVENTIVPFSVQITVRFEGGNLNNHVLQRLFEGKMVDKGRGHDFFVLWTNLHEETQGQMLHPTIGDSYLTRVEIAKTEFLARVIEMTHQICEKKGTRFAPCLVSGGVTETELEL